MDNMNNNSEKNNDTYLTTNDEQLKQEQIVENNENIRRIQDESVNMVCRQTELSYDQAKIELEKYNYNYIHVLNNYHNISNEKNEKNEKKSINQNIYNEIRNFMDIVVTPTEKKNEPN